MEGTMSTLSSHRTSPIGCALLTVVAIVLTMLAIWSLSQRRPAAAVVLAPTTSVAPTLTAAQRADITTIQIRVGSLAAAARKLDRLGQASHADLKWKSQVRAGIAALTGDQATMFLGMLPSHLAPLAKQIAETTERCRVAGDAIPTDSDQLTIAAVEPVRPQLLLCARELDRIGQSLRNLSTT
jgi:hypothetical protein